MKAAVISLGGKQHLVQEAETITVDAHLDQKEGDTLKVSDVLLSVSDSGVVVGTPTVAKAEVTLEVIKSGHHDKIRVATYKAKARQRKVRGHKQPATELKVVSIK